MTELSKTARASQVKEVKEKHVETTEEAIRQLRLERVAHIWPNPQRIDALLTAYDEAIAKLEAHDEMTKSLPYVLKLISDPSFVSVVESAGYKINVTNSVKQAIESSVVMAEIPAQEHDEHHLVDFGHHTTHPVAEGA